MKVIHLISGGDSGGAKTHIINLLSGLRDRASVELVCFMEGDFARAAREAGIDVTVIPGANVFATAAKLKKRIASGGYDIVHCHGSRANLIGALIRGGIAPPVVSTIHSDPRLDYLGRPAARLTYGTLNALALRRIRYRVAVSDSMRELLIGRGFGANNTFTIYNGVRFPGPAPERSRAQVLADYGIDPDCLVVGTAARFNPVKDLSTLVRGFAIAQGRCPRLRLLLAGDGPDEKRLRALAEELGVGDKVVFAGWVEDMRSFYAALDINSLTSLSETFPYAITEGALSALPTVASRVGGVPAIIKHGSTGLLFTAGDENELAARLTELAESRELRERLGRGLMDITRREFSQERTCQTQMEIYSAILRRERPGRDGVLICGAYGRENAGDDAILQAILASMRALDRDMPCTVLARRVRKTSAACGADVIYTFNVPSMLRVMKKTKLYINGGGSLIQDVTSRRSIWYYLFTLRAAKKRGNRVMMYGCGIGPVNYEGDRRMTARTLNRYVDLITLREAESRGELAAYGVTRPEIILAADPAMVLPAAAAGETDAFMRAHGMEPGGSYVCFALRRWPGFERKAPAIAAAARFAWAELGLTPVFLAINRHGDAAAAELVTAELSSDAQDIPFFAIDETMSAELMIGLLSRMRAVVSMRLHGLILAAGNGIPLVGVVYDPKVSAFLDYLGQTLYVGLEELDTPGLCALIREAAALSGRRDVLAADAARIRALEHRNAEAAKRLLELD